MIEAKSKWSRKSRYVASFGATILGAVCGGLLLKAGINQNDDIMKIVSLIILSITLLSSMWLYHGSVDEHEKEALFLSNSIAFYTLIIIGISSLILRTLSVPIIISIQDMLLASAVTGALAWLWRKYR